MGGVDLGQSAGIVALAALVIKESFNFVRPFKRKEPAQRVDVDWGRIAELMDVSVKPLETCMRQVMERMEFQSESLERQTERSNQLANELLLEQRKFNDLFLRFISRQEGLEEGRRHREPN